MGDDVAYRYACRLFLEICRQVCPHQKVETLDDTLGVLTQIDHMTAHLLKEAGYPREARDD